MNLPLMQALWLLDNMPSNLLANLFARIFMMSFAKLWMRLIGLKSLA
jgi:hypothetical protein